MPLTDYVVIRSEAHSFNAACKEADMASYYVNRNSQSNGDHEVHVFGCSVMPQPENRIYVGEHYTCVTAVVAAKQLYYQSNGCYWCCNPCHTS